MKRLILCLALITQLCYAKTPILTPTFSQRETATITLDNGLQAYLVSDPNLEQSGALLTVQAGSWDEPDEHPGIAHFLEHMLFLGTKKYPAEGEYQRFISHHNGMSNAFTASTYTAYLFTIDNKAFPEALDRFSHFFKEPLFNPSGVDRELKAIDQEYAKNLESDEFRQYFVLKELSSDKHPQKRFNIGSKETLQHVSQSTLKQWYEQHYSANLMRLVVYSSLPLDQLKALVTQDFTAIANKNLVPGSFPMEIMTPELKAHMVYVQPVKNMRTLTLIWELPRKFSHMRDEQPEHAVSFILGHEGKESLLAQLKREKLAEGLKSGTFSSGDAAMLFEVEITLTDHGINHVDDVISRTYQTLALLRQTGVPEELFNEIKQMATIQYQYQQREPLFTTLSKDGHYLPHYDMAKYPEQANIVQKYDPKAIQELINILTPNNAVYFLRAPPSLTGVKTDKQEPWLNVNYAVKPIPKSEMASWMKIDTAHPDIALPQPNPFIPNSLNLVNEPMSTDQLPLVPTPEKLVDNGEGILYFVPDNRYGVPKISWYVELKSPLIDASKPSKVVLADLVAKAVKEALNKYSYSADIAGLKYDVTRTDFGIMIHVEGYSEHAPKLFGEILRRMRELHPTEDKFKIYKQSLLREYQNASKELPVKQALETLKSAIYQSYTTPKQKTSAIRRITLDKFNQYATNLFDQYYVEALMYGNMSKDEALSIWGGLRDTLGGSPYHRDQQKAQEVIVLPERGGPYYIETTTKAQGNGAVLAIEGDGYSFEKRAAQQVLGQAVEQAFFAELRTKQQTGYIVHSWSEEIERQLFQIFAVQSNTHNVHDLIARFELFFETFVQELSHDVNPEAFEHIREALLTQLETPQKSFAEMSKLLQLLAFKYDGHFDWIDRRIEGFKNLTYSKLLTFSRDFLGPKNRRRLAILMKGETPSQTPTYQRLGNVEQLKKVSTFERQ